MKFNADVVRYVETAWLRNNNSFKYGYGGKLLVRKIMLEMGIVAKKNNDIRKATYELVIPPGDINLELVSRIIVEVYLHRNEIEPL